MTCACRIAYPCGVTLHYIGASCFKGVYSFNLSVRWANPLDRMDYSSVWSQEALRTQPATLAGKHHRHAVRCNSLLMTDSLMPAQRADMADVADVPTADHWKNCS